MHESFTRRRCCHRPAARAHHICPPTRDTTTHHLHPSMLAPCMQGTPETFYLKFKGGSELGTASQTLGLGQAAAAVAGSLNLGGQYTATAVCPSVAKSGSVSAALSGTLCPA